MTYGVGLLLGLVTLLVNLGLLVVGSLLRLSELLPLGAEHLADLTWGMLVIVVMRR